MRTTNGDLCAEYSLSRMMLSLFLAPQMIFTSQIVLNISLSKNVFHKCWIQIVFRFEYFNQNEKKSKSNIYKECGLSPLMNAKPVESQLKPRDDKDQDPYWF